MKHRLLYIITIIFISILIIISSKSCSNNRKLDEPKQETKEPEKDPYLIQEISKGQSIYSVLTDLGVSNSDIAYFTREMGQFVDFTSIQIGDILKVKFQETIVDTVEIDSVMTIQTEDVLTELIYQPDIITSHILYNTGDSLFYEKKELPYETKKRIVSGFIDKSMTHSLKDLGFDSNVRQEIIKPLEAAISFETDARKGDEFEVLLEEKFYNGEKLPGAKIYYSRYSGKRVKNKEAFRLDYGEASALNGMYTEKGKALVVGAVRTPLNYMHVTSGFGKRIHPISGKWKFHTGIDYRGSWGTPIYAVAKGRVTFSGRNGGFGNEVRIRHVDGSITQYAHMSKIYVKKGAYVRKGQKIGTVGSTGYSTGPHLHFGLMKHGRWSNPKNLKMIGAHQLNGDKLKLLKEQIESIREQLEYLKNQNKQEVISGI